MRTLFLTYGHIEMAGSRLRAFYPCRYLEDAQAIPIHEFIEGGTITRDLRNVVFQKLVDIPLLHFLKQHGVKVFWDVVDPSWWFSPADCAEIAQACDVLVSGNTALGHDLKAFSGKSVECIPDRMDMADFPIQHNEALETDTVKCIWFGWGQNRLTILGAWANLARIAANGHKIELTIFDDAPADWLIFGNEVKVNHIPWRYDIQNEIIASHDIAILPPYPGPWGKVKSNNKRLTAWACGIPAIDGFDYDELTELVISKEVRREYAEGGAKVLYQLYTIEKSVEQWKGLLA